MTKKEIVRTISEEIGLTQLQTKEIVQKTFDAIVEALVAERRIELREELPLGDDGIEIGVEARNRPGHLAADVDGADRLERPGGAHGLHDGAGGHRRGAHRDLRPAPPRPAETPERADWP